jgi:hypothetical protein
LYNRVTMTTTPKTGTLPAALEALRLALADTAENIAALEKENVRLIAEVTTLTEEIARIKAAKKTDGGGE